jgi:murein DD-endopeptidase
MFMSKKYVLTVFAIFLVCIAGSAYAREPSFLFPVSCTYGEDCWPVNYVDVDPADGVATDFKCRRKTYDTHKGTDFALSSVSQMRGGVDVLAAAAGQVLRVRDGESDDLKSPEELEDIRANNKDCGNGVLLDHGDGLQTIYCHLKNGSVTVKPKQKVKAGQKIAQVGMSGRAEFPHVHFGVLWEGGVVDPFTGVLNTKGCGQMKRNMWLVGLPVSYEEVVIFDGGFRAQVPDFEGIKRGSDENPIALPVRSAAFVFWAGFYNVEEGDEVVMQILDPDGAVFHARKETVAQTRARQYYFAGRKIGHVQLRPGIYKGIVEIMRGDDISRREEFSVRVQ